MASRPKRQSKAPERFKVWESGDKHEPFTVRNRKKEMKVEDIKKKEYQASYREKKKADVEERNKPRKEAKAQNL